MTIEQTNFLVEKYLAPRPEGELDLVAAARQALVNAGITAEGLAAFDNDRNVIFASNKNANVQRFKLNMWLDTQYMSTRLEVSNQRGMLLDAGPVQNWLEVFINFHIPSMKTLNLPKAY